MFFHFISDAAAGFLNRKAKIAAEKYRRKIMENNRPGGGTDGADGRKRTCEKKESRQQSDAAGGQVGMVKCPLKEGRSRTGRVQTVNVKRGAMSSADSPISIRCAAC